MLRKLMTFAVLLVTLASLAGCVIYDPGYYPYSRTYYRQYYGPYLYTPFWFGGYYYYGDFDRGHDGHRGGGGGRHR